MENFANPPNQPIQPEPNPSSEVFKQRFFYAIAQVLVSFTQGKQCTLTTSRNQQAKGLLYNLLDQGCTICCCEEGAEYTESKRFLSDDIISIEFKAISPLTSQQLKSDYQIARQAKVLQRELTPWVGQGDSNLQLEEMDSAPWDQFKINEQKFGVVSSYSEDLYTTAKPDESELPIELVMKAKRLQDINETADPGYGNEDDEEAHFGAVLGSGRYKDYQKKEEPVEQKPVLERRASENFDDVPFKNPWGINHYKQIRSSIQNGRSLEPLLLNNPKAIESLDLAVQKPQKNPKLMEVFFSFKQSVRQHDRVIYIQKYSDNLTLQKGSLTSSQHGQEMTFDILEPPSNLIDHIFEVWADVRMQYQPWNQKNERALTEPAVKK